MTTQREFAVPKDKQLVTVHLVGGEARTGNIFLEYFPEALTLHQKIKMFLEDANRFFPLTVEGTPPTFINKKSVSVLEVAISDKEPAFLLMHIEDITTLFTDGTALSGELLAEVPKEKARLSDCLNLPESFLSLKKEKALCYINKSAIQKVVYSKG
ncbi:MAG: hypothetical protein A2X58_08975 [Nitrospirae bacterium GWC2_56_14]|nr:MAG: hypothetical protein A2X58_08975 [Nitrospirae bacterium GWC2_56_14]